MIPLAKSVEMNWDQPRLGFESLMKSWEEYATASSIIPYIWYKFQKEFWNQVHTMPYPQVMDSVNMSHIPFHIRWALAEKFPEYAKKLLIDTRSFDIGRNDYNYHHMVYDKDDIYASRILAPRVIESGSTPLTIFLKPYIRSVFKFYIS